ncbi:MAG: aldehyde-activating protein [Pseudomonadota bacterium]
MTQMRRSFEGSCHCGRISVRFETNKAPASLEVRTCQCAFCRRHGARAISDPEGFMAVTAEAGREAKAYRFGLGVTDFLVCPDCGCYVAAVMNEGDKAYGIVNIRMLADEAAFPTAETPRVYDAEDAEARLARRRAAWTPMAAAP